MATIVTNSCSQLTHFNSTTKFDDGHHIRAAHVQRACLHTVMWKSHPRLSTPGLQTGKHHSRWPPLRAADGSSTGITDGSEAEMPSDSNLQEALVDDGKSVKAIGTEAEVAVVEALEGKLVDDVAVEKAWQNGSGRAEEESFFGKWRKWVGDFLSKSS